MGTTKIREAHGRAGIGQVNKNSFSFFFVFLFFPFCFCFLFFFVFFVFFFPLFDQFVKNDRSPHYANKIAHDNLTYPNLPYD